MVRYRTPPSPGRKPEPPGGGPVKKVPTVKSPGQQVRKQFVPNPVKGRPMGAINKPLKKAHVPQGPKIDWRTRLFAAENTKKKK